MERKMHKGIRKFLALCLAGSLFLPAAAPVSAGGNEVAEVGQLKGVPLEKVFPDEAFREYLAGAVDTDGNGSLSAQEAEAVTELPVAGLGIASLKGIGCFSNLQILDCRDNSIGALDLSGLENLQKVECAGNRVSLSANAAGQVDFSGIPDMERGQILEVSQGTWTEDGLLQLPEDFQGEELAYRYAVSGNGEGQEESPDKAWELEVTVGLRYTAGSGAPQETGAPAEMNAAAAVTPGQGASSNGNAILVEEEVSAQEPNARVSQEQAAGSGGTAGLEATSKSAKITSCKILSSKTQVAVQASIPSTVKSKDGKYYLFAISPLASKLSKPVASVQKKKKVTFQVPLGYKLQSKFLVGVKKAAGKYEAICEEKYISNPEILASSTLAFTKGDSKKGLQFGESFSDAIQLGVNYCLFNVDVTEFTQVSGSKLDYKYNGKTYSFNQNAFDKWGSLFSQFQDAKMNLSVVFRLPWVDGQTDMIYSAARSRDTAHNFYAWNVRSSEARKKYEALFSCIAEQFDGMHGRGYINNYIIGNEVNAFDQWNYTGSSSLKTNANLYADTFQVVYMAVKSKCKNARISISIDHSWNVKVSGKLHSAKSFLDAFAARLEEYGSPNFTIAYHAYSYPLKQADFWNGSSKYVKNSKSSPYITMKNIQQLTKYVKAKYGKNTRIMLTEQGFSSHGAKGEKKQAAAIAYAFYKAEFNSMIDCIIFRSQADAQAEIDSDGLYMGLWTVGMGKKKASYNVFQNMDTTKCESATKSCRQYLGISKWTKLVPGYKASRFQ